MVGEVILAEHMVEKNRMNECAGVEASGARLGDVVKFGVW